MHDVMSEFQLERSRGEYGSIYVSAGRKLPGKESSQGLFGDAVDRVSSAQEEVIQNMNQYSLSVVYYYNGHLARIIGLCSKCKLEIS